MVRKKYNRKKTIGIYKITNTINNKVYIGASKNIESRIQGHKNNSKTRTSDFYNDIRELGYDKFKKEIIEICNLETLDEREVFWIAEYRKTHEVYNVLDGGKSGFKRVLSEETKAKISKTLTGKPSTKSAKEREWARVLLAKKNPNSRKVVCGGICYNSIAELARILNMSEVSLSKRIKGEISSESYLYNLDIKFLGEDSKMKLKKEKPYTIFCDTASFKSVKECSFYFGIKEGTMAYYLRGERTMPEELKKINLRRVK